jgi:RNA polymerase sigma factor (sigma-70 family)
MRQSRQERKRRSSVGASRAGWQVAAAEGTQAARGEHESRIATVVARHEQTLLRVAQQFSLCHDDALDAYQRALEIFVRRVSTVDPATEVAWLKVVVRHEAMAIRRARSRLVASDDVDLDAIDHGDARSVEEQLAATQRVRRSAEALRALKPDEAKALVLKAHGLSYDEIRERYGWTYTKVNRSITEGRRRFLGVYEEIESGKHCEAFADTLEALAAGSATPRQLLAIRPHLRHCDGCRSTVRALHLSRLRRALLLLPLAAGIRLPWRDRLAEIVHRSGASDVAMSIQAASAGGGGRLATAATVLGMCLGGAGVGTVCVSQLLDEAPQKRSQVGAPHRAAKNAARADDDAPRPRAVAAVATPAPTAHASPHPAATAAPTRVASGRRHRARNAKAAVAEDEFGFERTTSSSPNTPASSATAVAATSDTSSPSSSGSTSAPPVPAPPASNPAAEEFTP